MILLLLADLDGVIAKDGRQILYIPEDLARFKRRTDGHILVMGRKTFEVTGALPNRETFVMTRKEREDLEHVRFFRSESELDALLRNFPGKKIFLVGGAEIAHALFHRVDEAFITRVPVRTGGDKILPPLDTRLTLVEKTPIIKDIVEEHWIRQ